jgi:hypothetical protein
VDTPDFSVAGILKQIPLGAGLKQQYLSRKDKIRKTWNNWMRLRRRRPLARAKADAAAA